MRTSESDRVCFGVFEVNLGTGELRKNGVLTKLAPQPAKLLVLLLRHSGELVTREQIQNHLWGDGTVVDFDQGLNHCIRQVRSELNEEANRPVFIETVPRRGYRFIAPVSHLEKNVARVPTLSVRLRLTFGLASVFVFAAVLLLYLKTITRHPSSGSHSNTTPSLPTLATPEPADDSSAQLAYIKGRYYWNKRTPEALAKALEYFQVSIDKDHNLALAYAGLADTYNLMGYLGALPRAPAYTKANSAAVHALQLDNSLAEAHAALADIRAVHDWQFAEAQREYGRAIQLKPLYATGHQWYATFLAAVGRSDESIHEARRAVDLDPLSLIINVNLGRCYYFAEQYDNAVERFSIAIEMDPRFVMAHDNLGLVYAQKGSFSEAIRELKIAERLSQASPRVMASLAYTYAVSDKRQPALQITERLQRAAKTMCVSSYDIASIYAGLNDRTTAFQWLQKAYDERDGDLIFLKVEPRLASLRQDSRFISLVEKIGLPP